MDENVFYLKVAHALSGCQLVEQQLKLYITQALDLARKCIGAKMTFTMCGEDYANSSLEQLIKIFKKLTANQALAGELNRFKDERNFLSHEGITHCLDYEGELVHSTAEELKQGADSIQVEAERLCNVIHEEANKFRGHLWCDDVSEG